MNYSIVIDNREKYIIKGINKKPKLKSYINVESLIIGDIIIKNNQNEYILIIERKTWSDLNNSIIDGRYHNQKERLIKYCIDNNLRRDQIMYIIEGEYISNNKLLKTTLKTACVNLQIRDGFRIYFTESILDTIEFLQKIINCINKYSYYNPLTKNINQNNEFYKSLNIIKKDNLTPKRVYISQLCIIPGISIKKAEEIFNIYPNWAKLLNALNNSNNGDILKEINGIGPRLSQKIYNYIINNNEQ